MPQIVEMRYIDPQKLEALLAEQFPSYPPSYRVEVKFCLSILPFGSALDLAHPG